METLSCNNCGEMIELPTTANYATCARCGTHLVVRRGETARYTEVLDAEAPVRSDAAERQIEVGTVNGAEFERMKLKLALLSLDHEWEDKRAPYMIHTINGILLEPSNSGVLGYIILGSLIPIGSLIAYMILKPSMSQVEMLQLVTLAIVLPFAICGWMAKRSYTRYRNYMAAKNEYLAQRNELTHAGVENGK
jgi:DNA-directed RNA polymerase subunit RPC12/RpoP